MTCTATEMFPTSKWIIYSNQNFSDPSGYCGTSSGGSVTFSTHNATFPFFSELQQQFPSLPFTSHTEIILHFLINYALAARSNNVRFLDLFDQNPPLTEPYMAHPFACGRAVASSIVDSLTIMTFFHPVIFNIFNTLVFGQASSELEQIATEGAGKSSSDALMLAESSDYYKVQKVRSQQRKCKNIVRLYVSRHAWSPKWTGPDWRSKSKKLNLSRTGWIKKRAYMSVCVKIRKFEQNSWIWPLLFIIQMAASL